MVKTSNYVVELINKGSEFATEVGRFTWTKEEVDKYWDEQVMIWLNDGLRVGSKLILRNEKTNKIVKEEIKRW